MRILIADDSIAFRAAIRAALSEHPEFTSVGVASTGKIALGRLRNEAYDLMVLDMEMPEGNGIDVMQVVKDENIKVKTILFASPTEQSYGQVRQALALGAADFLAKPKGEAGGGVEGAIALIRAELVPRIRSLLGHKPAPSVVAQPTSAPIKAGPGKRLLSTFVPEAIVIASSTGGPMALERFFGQVKPPLRIPIFICQHMPPPFTRQLAERLTEICKVPAAEGVQGEVVVAGRIYIAPGDFHMRVVRAGTALTIEINQQPKIHYVRPAADPLFASAAAIYGKNLMGFVLTGMGEDGKQGAVIVREHGGAVMIQDKASAIVWGMPGATYEAGAFDDIGTPEACGAMAQLMAH